MPFFDDFPLRGVIKIIWTFAVLSPMRERKGRQWTGKVTIDGNWDFLWYQSQSTNPNILGFDVTNYYAMDDKRQKTNKEK